jgi:diguanylate cyclase (GGDEF)-like protein/PAS domain S-box-containing protein
VSEIDYRVVSELSEHGGGRLGEGGSPNLDIAAGEQSITQIDGNVVNLANESDHRFATIFESLGDGIVYQNQHGEIVLCNDSASRILGLTIDQIEGRTSFDPRWHALKEDGSPFPGADHPAMVALTTGEPQHNVMMNVSKPDGTRTLIKINAIPIYDNGSEIPTSVVTSFSDVTSINTEKELLRDQLRHLVESQAQIEAKRRRLEQANQRLRDESDSDPLTKLKNRKGFFERLSSEVSLASRNQLPLSLLILDIDRLKEINLELGYESGDELLVLVSQALHESCRLSDFIARYRSEEFAMILPCTALHQARNFAERLLDSIQSIKFQVPVLACIGVAEFKMGMLLNDLVDETEEALFRAKAAGAGSCYSEAT